jgi:transposase
MDDDTTSVIAALFGLAGFEVLAAADAGGELELLVQTTADLVGCPSCGAVARAKDRRPSWCGTCRAAAERWCCAGGSGCGAARRRCVSRRPGPERHPAIGPRATLTERARQWAFEQVGEHDAAVSTVAAQLGVAWWTVMDQVIDR